MDILIPYYKIDYTIKHGFLKKELVQKKCVMRIAQGYLIFIYFKGKDIDITNVDLVLN